MDSAKAAVKDFMSKSGHHDTTVHEKVAPAVQHETIERREKEEVQTAIDKEVHQDHYHTSQQPVYDREVLPEQHHHNIIPVEHRSFDHGDDAAVQQRLAQEQAQFKNTTERVHGEKQREMKGALAGEHIHHHVHETIQPVIEKQTIEPHVTHTTVPIHEVHHNAAQHHTTSALPAVSMEEFKKQGGVLTGREERYDGFEGEPRSVGGAHGSSGHSGAVGGAVAGAAAGHHSGHTASGAAVGAGLGNHHDKTRANESGLGSTGTGAGYGSTAGATGTGAGVGSAAGTGSGLGNTTSNTSSSSGKPSLLDKLNPKKDANGDGQAGFMK